MYPADPRWLEILKASGWQTMALTLACTLIYFLIKHELVPTDGNPLWIAVPAIGAIIFGCLFFATIVSTSVNAIRPLVDQWRFDRHQQRLTQEYIPHMTEKDKEIIGYLLHHNQKMFSANQDGGYAAHLISKGIIRSSGKPGQIVNRTCMPFEIPNHIWLVLESNREQFPYIPPKDHNSEKYPWAIPWMG